jgi:hypothetical protein
MTFDVSSTQGDLDFTAGVDPLTYSAKKRFAFSQLSAAAGIRGLS